MRRGLMNIAYSILVTLPVVSDEKLFVHVVCLLKKPLKCLCCHSNANDINGCGLWITGMSLCMDSFQSLACQHEWLH